MKKQHCIESAILQVDYASEELAFAQSGVIEDFARDGLLAAINDVFDEISDSDFVLRIDLLEVDLGEIPLAWYRDDFAVRLRERVRESLQEQLLEQHIAGSEAGGVVSREQSEFDLLCQFLTTGQLPWNAAFDAANTLDAMLQRVAQHRGEELLAFLRRSQSSATLLTRLGEQFSSAALARLFAAFSGVDHVELRQLVSDVLKLAGGSASSALARSEAALWQALFRGYLSSASRRTSNDGVLQILIKALAAARDLAPGQAVVSLLQAAQQDGDREYLQRALLRQARGFNVSGNGTMQHVLDNHDGAAIASGSTQGAAMVRQFRFELQQAMRAGPSRELVSGWRSSLQRFREVIRELLLTEGQDVAVRRTVAHDFPEPIIRDMIVILEPVHHEFIEQLASQPQPWLANTAQQPLPETKARQALWEYSLAYLIVERGSRFNKKSYLGSVMRQLAAAANLAELELYDSLVFQLQPAADHDSLREEMLSLLLELREELGPADTVGTGNRAQPAPAEARSVSSPAKRRAGTETASPREAAADAFRQALVRADLSRLRPLWTTIVKEHQQWLIATLHRECAELDVRRVLARSLPGDMFQELVRLVAPEGSKFIATAVGKDSLLFQRAGKSEQAMQDSRTAVREFTLSYLTVNRGSRFNQRTFMAGMIKKIAAHENLSVLSLFNSINLAIGRKDGFSADQRTLLTMLLEIGRELRLEDWQSGAEDERQSILAVAGPDSRQATTPGRSALHAGDPGLETGERPDLIRPYLLYEKLLAALLDTGAASGKHSYHVVRLIHELVEDYPWQLHRLNQEVLRRRLALENIMPRLPRILQRKLLLAFFASSARLYPFDFRAFERRLQDLDARSSSTSQHGALLLKRLIRQQADSLEALFAGLYSAGQGDGESARHGPALHGLADKTLGGRDRKPASNESPTAAATAGDDRPGMLDRAGARAVLENAFATSAGRQPVAPKMLVLALETLLANDPRGLEAMLRELLQSRDAVDRLTSIVPESLLLKILILLRPADHCKAVLYADLMTIASVDASNYRTTDSNAMHLAKWQFVFGYLLVDGQQLHEVGFVRQLASFLFARSAIADRGVFYQRLAREVTRTATTATHVAAARVRMILENTAPEEEPDLTQVEQQPARDLFSALAEREQARQQAGSFRLDGVEKEIAPLEEVYIDNAGLVLLAPYLPRYFDMLGLVSGKAFKDRESAERGVHLLQYLLDGRCESYEYQLVLNKLLCGVKAGKPISRGIEISTAEADASNSLLRGIIANWPVLKNTSVAGLQETFLQRQAHLQRRDDLWKLLVEAKPYDMLLDQLPWSYKTIKFPWMEQPIHVDWR